MKKHQDIINNNFYHCDFCGYKYSRKSSFQSHMVIHMSPESQPKYQCAYCSETFLRTLTRTMHERRFHTQVNKKYRCDECGKNFKFYNGLWSHRKNAHNTENFPCQHCDKVFPSTLKRRLHFDETHKPRVACEICGVMTPSLAVHRRKVHRGRLKCTFEGCDKDFASTASLLSHKYTHETPKSLKCKTCHAEFNNEYRLKIHENRQHKYEKRKCQVPGCTHSSTRYLKMHYQNHRGIDSKEKARLIAELKSR